MKQRASAALQRVRSEQMALKAKQEESRARRKRRLNEFTLKQITQRTKEAAKATDSAVADANYDPFESENLDPIVLPQSSKLSNNLLLYSSY